MFLKWLKEFFLMILTTILVFVCGGAIIGIVALGIHLIQLSIVFGFGYIGVIFLIGIGIAAYLQVKDK